jgi:uncharacterized membrane protein
MIQLIGFLLCVYMLVRGLDIRSRIEDRKSSSSVTTANAAWIVAVAGAVIFFVLLIAQGNSMPSVPSSSPY